MCQSSEEVMSFMSQFNAYKSKYSSKMENLIKYQEVIPSVLFLLQMEGACHMFVSMGK